MPGDAAAACSRTARTVNRNPRERRRVTADGADGGGASPLSAACRPVRATYSAKAAGARRATRWRDRSSSQRAMRSMPRARSTGPPAGGSSIRWSVFLTAASVAASIGRPRVKRSGPSFSGNARAHSERSAAISRACAASGAPSLRTIVGTGRAGGHQRPALHGVEAEGEHPAGQRLGLAAQLLVDAAPVVGGEEPAGAVGPLADPEVAVGDGLEGIDAHGLRHRAPVGVQPRRPHLAVALDLGRGHHHPGPAAAHPALLAGEALLGGELELHRGQSNPPAARALTHAGGVVKLIFPLLGGRPTVGHMALNHAIGVRIPASQPIPSSQPRSSHRRLMVESRSPSPAP